VIRRRLVKPDGRALVLYSDVELPESIEAPQPRGATVVPEPELRWHPLRGEWVAFARHRQDRTFLPPPEYDPLAPTVPGREPTELPDAPWKVAVFENRFPSLSLTAPAPAAGIVEARPGVGACEVVVYTPDRDRLRAVLTSFPEGGMGFVATVPANDGIDIVGSAVSVFNADRTSCEFAITVAAGFAGVGLAKTLMIAIIDESRRRGVKEMEGFVLAQNQSMLGLARRLGFRIEREPGDASVRVCRLTLNPS